MGFLDGVLGNASRVNSDDVQREYGKLLGATERVAAGYRLIRDMLIFTNQRLLLVDKQGMTGRKVEYHSLPYRSITHFSVETAGHMDLDAELKIYLSGMPAPIEKRFGKGVDIYEVQALLAQFVSGAANAPAGGPTSRM